MLSVDVYKAWYLFDGYLLNQPYVFLWIYIYIYIDGWKGEMDEYMYTGIM